MWPMNKIAKFIMKHQKYFAGTIAAAAHKKTQMYKWARGKN